MMLLLCKMVKSIIKISKLFLTFLECNSRTFKIL